MRAVVLFPFPRNSSILAAAPLPVRSDNSSTAVYTHHCLGIAFNEAGQRSFAAKTLYLYRIDRKSKLPNSFERREVGADSEGLIKGVKTDETSL